MTDSPPGFCERCGNPGPTPYSVPMRARGLWALVCRECYGHLRRLAQTFHGLGEFPALRERLQTLTPLSGSYPAPRQETSSRCDPGDQGGAGNAGSRVWARLDGGTLE